MIAKAVLERDFPPEFLLDHGEQLKNVPHPASPGHGQKSSRMVSLEALRPLGGWAAG